MSMNWQADLEVFVGKSFETEYNNRMRKFDPILGEVMTDNHFYQLRDSGGYGELKLYDGTTLSNGELARGFNTIITPQEYENTIAVKYKDSKIDKSGTCKSVGSRLGLGAYMTVYRHVLRYFENAANIKTKGGDGKPWAAEDHPIASKGGDGLVFEADPEAGTYSNKHALALNGSNVRKIRAIANRTVTPDGNPALVNLNMMLVSPELEETAAKMFGVENKYIPKENPDDNTNAANPNADMTYLVVGGGAEGLGAKDWALCDSRLMKELFKLVYITKPKVLTTDTDNPLIKKFTAYMDFAIGHGDARMIHFSYN